LLTSLFSSIDGGIKLRPTASDLEEMGEDFKGWWEEKFAHANALDKPVCWIGIADA
jgi:alcohol oxidase